LGIRALWALGYLASFLAQAIWPFGYLASFMAQAIWPFGYLASFLTQAIWPFGYLASFLAQAIWPFGHLAIRLVLLLELSFLERLASCPEWGLAGLEISRRASYRRRRTLSAENRVLRSTCT
jgi:hypothetical protein